MFGNETVREFKVANRSKAIVPFVGAALCAMQILFFTLSNSHAAIVGTGDLDPLDPTTWTSGTDGYVALTSTATMTVDGGSELLSRFGYVGYDAESTGMVTVTGANSKWTASSLLYVGHSGNGTLSIKAGGQVSDDAGYVCFNSGSTGTVTVNGNGSQWTNYDLNIGCSGNGILNVEAGGSVQNYFLGFLGYDSGATGTATVTGADSNWTSGDDLHIGYSGSGILSIKAGGRLGSNANAYLGYYSDSTGTATVSGAGSMWTSDGFLYVGRSGNGSLKIEAGGQVAGNSGYLGYYSGSIGTATVTGVGSMWINSVLLDVGNSGSGTLTIGSDGDSGGLVKAETLKLAENNSGTGTCNLNQGGTLQTAAIVRGDGIANFNWNDGTIRNFDPSTDLTISSDLVLKLAATGTHAFNIDPSRMGTVDAVLSDATSGGSLKKIGAGALALTAVNTYSGATTVEQGRFKVTGSILNTSGIVVAQAGILELAKSSGSATGAGVGIDNAGTVLVSTGAEKVGTISGIGITQVTGSASLTAISIAQNALTIGTGAVEAMSQVPEPSTLVLLGLGSLCFLACYRRTAIFAWKPAKLAG